MLSGSEASRTFKLIFQTTRFFRFPQDDSSKDVLRRRAGPEEQNLPTDHGYGKQIETRSLNNLSDCCC